MWHSPWRFKIAPRPISKRHHIPNALVLPLTLPLTLPLLLPLGLFIPLERLPDLTLWEAAWIAPGFESHQCLAGMWKRWLGYHDGHQGVGRCRTRSESQGTCNVTHTPLLSVNKAEPTLALKPRGDVTRNPKQGYQWPHKKDPCPPKNF